jgi:2-aminoadipate transaminase
MYVPNRDDHFRGDGGLKPSALARRAARLPATVSVPDHGHTIPFDSGHGFPGVFPDLTAAAEKALTVYRDEVLQYGSRPGLLELREWIARQMTADGATVSADDMIIVNGAKQGIELICRILLDPGDSIVVTAPTYFTAIPIFRSYDAEFIEIGQDEEGLDTDELARTLQRLQSKGQNLPKFVYTIPEFHNPTGVTMSLARRKALLDLADQYGLYVVEDSPYREIRFEGSVQSSLKALDRTGSVIHLGTFSKLMAPGLRIGWVTAPSDLLARMMQLKADGGTSPLVQRIIVEWLKAGNLAAHTERARDLYRNHRDSMVAALRREMPEVSTVVPHGGYYVWVTLPGEVDGDEMAKRAALAGVTIIPGSKFFAGNGPGYPRNDGVPKNRIRLAYSFATPEQIDDGVRRLAEVLHAMRR